MRTDYRIDDFQESYFVIRSFDELFAETYKDFAALYRQAADRPDLQARRHSRRRPPSTTAAATPMSAAATRRNSSQERNPRNAYRRAVMSCSPFSLPAAAAADVRRAGGGACGADRDGDRRAEQRSHRRKSKTSISTSAASIRTTCFPRSCSRTAISRRRTSRTLVGKTVGVTGEIKLYNGKPEIV